MVVVLSFAALVLASGVTAGAVGGTGEAFAQVGLGHLAGYAEGPAEIGAAGFTT